MEDEKSQELLKELREKMEARRKQLNLKWDGWEENERERQGGGMLIVIGFIAGIAAIAGTVIYFLTGL
jgi:F0F1-type ATP synthase assembly protein I